MSLVRRPGRRTVPEDIGTWAPPGRLRLPDDVVKPFEKGERTEHHQGDGEYGCDLEYGTPEENC